MRVSDVGWAVGQRHGAKMSLATSINPSCVRVSRPEPLCLPLTVTGDQKCTLVCTSKPPAVASVNAFVGYDPL